jgi:hypothetical protein
MNQLILKTAQSILRLVLTKHKDAFGNAAVCLSELVDSSDSERAARVFCYETYYEVQISPTMIVVEAGKEIRDFQIVDVPDNVERVFNTIVDAVIHEVAHVLDRERNKIRTMHGESWVSCMEELGASPNPLCLEYDAAAGTLLNMRPQDWTLLGGNKKRNEMLRKFSKNWR